MAWVYDTAPTLVGMTLTFTLADDGGNTGTDLAASMMTHMFGDANNGTLTGTWSVRSGTPRYDGTDGTVTRVGATITIVSTNAVTESSPAPAATDTISVLSFNGDVTSDAGSDIRNGVTFGDPIPQGWLLGAAYTEPGLVLTFQNSAQTQGIAQWIEETIDGGTASWFSVDGGNGRLNGPFVFDHTARTMTGASWTDDATGTATTVAVGNDPFSGPGFVQFEWVDAGGTTQNVSGDTASPAGTPWGGTVALIPASTTEWILAADYTANDTTMTFQSEEQARGFVTFIGTTPMTALFFGTTASWGLPTGGTPTFAGATVTLPAGTTGGLVNASAGDAVILIQGDPPLSTMGSPGNTLNDVLFGASVATVTEDGWRLRTATQALESFGVPGEPPGGHSRQDFSFVNAATARAVFEFLTGDPTVTSAQITYNATGGGHHASFTDTFSWAESITLHGATVRFINNGPNAQAQRSATDPDSITEITIGGETFNATSNFGNPGVRNGVNFGQVRSVTEWRFRDEVTYVGTGATAQTVFLEDPAQMRGILAYLVGENIDRISPTNGMGNNAIFGNQNGMFLQIDVDAGSMTGLAQHGDSGGVDQTFPALQPVRSLSFGRTIPSVGGLTTVAWDGTGTAPVRNGITWGQSFFTDITEANLQGGDTILRVTFNEDPGDPGDVIGAYTLSAGTITEIRGTGTTRLLTLDAAATADVDVTWIGGDEVTAVLASSTQWTLAEDVAAGATSLTLQSVGQVQGFQAYFADAQRTDVSGVNGEIELDFLNRIVFNNGADTLHILGPFTYTGDTIGFASIDAGVGTAGDVIRSVHFNSNNGDMASRSTQPATTSSASGLTWGQSVNADIFLATLENLNQVVEVTFDVDPGDLALTDFAGVGTIERIDGTGTTRRLILETALTADTTISYLGGTEVDLEIASLTEWMVTDAGQGFVEFQSDAMAAGFWEYIEGTQSNIRTNSFAGAATRQMQFSFRYLNRAGSVDNNNVPDSSAYTNIGINDSIYLGSTAGITDSLVWTANYGRGVNGGFEFTGLEGRRVNIGTYNDGTGGLGAGFGNINGSASNVTFPMVLNSMAFQSGGPSVQQSFILTHVFTGMFGDVRNEVPYGASRRSNAVRTATMQGLNQEIELTFDFDPGDLTADDFTLSEGTVAAVSGTGITRALRLTAPATDNITVNGVETTGYEDLNAGWVVTAITTDGTALTGDITFETERMAQSFAEYIGTGSAGGSRINFINGAGGVNLYFPGNPPLDTESFTFNSVDGRAVRVSNNDAGFGLATTLPRAINDFHVGGTTADGLLNDAGARQHGLNIGGSITTRNGVPFGAIIDNSVDLVSATLMGIPSNLLTLTFNVDPGAHGTNVANYTVPEGVTLVANPATQTGITRTFTFTYTDDIEDTDTITYSLDTEGVTFTGFQGNESPVFSAPIVEIVDSGITADEINGLTLQFTASDPEGDPFSFHLQTQAPGGPELTVTHDGLVRAGDGYVPPVVTADTTYTYVVRATGPSNNFSETNLVLEVLGADAGYSFDGDDAVFYGNESCALAEQIADWASEPGLPDGTRVSWSGGVFLSPATFTAAVPPSTACRLTWAGVVQSPTQVGLNRDPSILVPVDNNGDPINTNNDQGDGIFYVLAADNVAVNVRIAGVTGRVVFADPDRFDNNRPVDLRVAPALERDGNTDDRDYGDEDSDDFGDGWYDDEYFIPQDIYVRPVLGTHGSTVHEFDFVVNPDQLVRNAYTNHLFIRDGDVADGVAVRRDEYTVTYTGNTLRDGTFVINDYGTFADPTCDGHFGTFTGDSAQSLDGNDVDDSFTTTYSETLYSEDVSTGGEWLMTGEFNRLPELTNPTTRQFAQRLVDLDFGDVGPRRQDRNAAVGSRNPRAGVNIGAYALGDQVRATESQDFNTFEVAGDIDYDAGAFDRDHYTFFDDYDYRFFGTVPRLEYTARRERPAIPEMGIRGGQRIAETHSQDASTPSYGGLRFSDDTSRGSSNTTFHTFRLRNGLTTVQAAQAVHDAYNEILNFEEPGIADLSAVNNNIFTVTPRQFGLDSTFTIEALSNNANDVERFTELLRDNTVEKRGAFRGMSIDSPVDPPDRAINFSITDDLEDRRLSAVFPWRRDQVNFNIEYPLFAQGRNTGEVAAADVTYTYTDGSSYESYVERVEMAITPEFDTEMVTSLALWADGFAREFTDQPRIHNRLEVRAMGTNYPGQSVNLRVEGGNVLPISEGYKTDLRVHGRFINLRITDSVTDPTEDPTNVQRDQIDGLAGTTYEGPELDNSYSPNTAWRLSGMQADVKKQGTR